MPEPKHPAGAPAPDPQAPDSGASSLPPVVLPPEQAPPPETHYAEVQIGNAIWVVSEEDIEWPIGEWGGMPNFICKRCGFPTVEALVMRDHIEEHRRREAVEAQSAAAVAATGALIIARH